MKEPFGIDKSELAVIALLRHRSIKKAAAEVGIHPVTVWRWLKLPQFREQLRQAQAQLYSQALARLQQSSSAAADALIAMLHDPNTPPASRIRIAEFVLEQSKTGFALEEIDFEKTDPNDVFSDGSAADPQIPDPPKVDNKVTRRKPVKRARAGAARENLATTSA